MRVFRIIREGYALALAGVGFLALVLLKTTLTDLGVLLYEAVRGSWHYTHPRDLLLLTVAWGLAIFSGIRNRRDGCQQEWQW